MKNRVVNHLLATVGAVLLIGLIASCGGDSEPRFKVIESREYTEANMDRVWEEFWVKHINGKPRLSDAEGKTIYESYRDDVWALVRPEMIKMSSTAAGIFLFMKVDQYKMIGNAYYKDGSRFISYYFYDF